MNITLETTQALTAGSTASTENDLPSGTYVATKLTIANTDICEVGSQIKIEEGATNETAIIIRVINSTEFVVEQLTNIYTTAAVVTFLSRTNPGSATGTTLIRNSTGVYVNGTVIKAEKQINKTHLAIKLIRDWINDYLFHRDGTKAMQGDLNLAGYQLVQAVIENKASDYIAPTLEAGLLWLNTTENKIKAYINGSIVKLATESFQRLPKNYRGSAPPVYATASTVTVARLNDRNHLDDGDIIKDSSTTLDLSTTGLNGILQSSNLAGTASCASTTVTGVGTAFSTDFIVGDVIWFNGGAARRITAIASNTSLTVESALTQSSTTYRRGGEAPNTFYNYYSVTDPTAALPNGVTPGLVASTRNVALGETLVDLPANYNRYCQQKAVLNNNSSSNIIDFIVEAGWPDAPTILYRASETIDTGSRTTGEANVLANGSQSTYTAVGCSRFVPRVSRKIVLNVLPRNSGAYGQCRATGSTNERQFGGTADTPSRMDMDLSASQSFDYKRTSGTGTFDADVVSYTITEF